MQTHVYANDREICSKAADGKSMAAFPDVCWSPPGPPAGPVPLPYPNTTFAADLTNGTKTVFICNTEVAQKDKSYFATSTGDEPATTAFAKGINTGALKGKAYFTSWSMDVKAEGLNVARHIDMMTHNHASPGGNTPAQVYFDDPSKRSSTACRDELSRINMACKEDEEGEEHTQKLRTARKGFLRKISARFEKLSEKFKSKQTQSDDNSWMEHCDGLWIKPSTNYLEDLKEFGKQLEGIKNDMASFVWNVAKPIVESIGNEIMEKLAKEAAERGVKLGARAGARWLGGAAGATIGGVGAIVTEGVATLWNIYDWGSTAIEGYEFTRDAYAKISQLSDIMGDFEKAVGELDGIYKQAVDNPQAAAAQAMGVFARLNPCTRARRCILVPYRNTGTIKSLSGHGCCPGQTGHHVLPHEMTKGGACPGYTKGGAPTVCVEGVNNTHGTHGMIHRKLASSMKDFTSPGILDWNGKDELSYDEAAELGAESIRDTFPESKCSAACLKAQLDAYYRNKCTKPLKPKAGVATTEEEDADAIL